MRPGSFWITAGATLLCVPCAGLFVATAGFALGQPVGAWEALVGVLAGLAMGAWVGRALGLSRAQVGLSVLAVPLAVFVASGVLCGGIYDLGFDSQSYHQLAIVELANGWNPLRGGPSTGGVYALFVAHYSTGTWIQAALVHALTGELEAGKLVNVVAIAASFCLARGALEFTGVASRRLSLLVALAAALNPVATVQALTFYVDGYLASSMVSLAAVLLLCVADPRRAFLTLGAVTIVLLATTKFTGVVYPLPLLAVAAALLYRRTRAWVSLRRFVAAHAVAYTLAVGFVGFHPYVTNAVGHGHPFYPLRGPVVAHTITGLRPPELSHVGSRLERLLRSLLADPAKDWRGSEDIYKVPLSVSADELELYATPDARVGGWGPLFSAACVASLVGVGLLFTRAARAARAGLGRSTLFLVAGALLASVLTNSECWWARLAPQLALLPLVALIALSRRGLASAASVRACGGAILGLVLANAALVVAAQALLVPRHSAELERFLAETAHGNVVLYVSDRWVAPLRRLREHGIRFVAVRDDGDEPDPGMEARVPCEPLRVFPGTMQEVRYCALDGAFLAIED